MVRSEGRDGLNSSKNELHASLPIIQSLRIRYCPEDISEDRVLAEARYYCIDVDNVSLSGMCF